MINSSSNPVIPNQVSAVQPLWIHEIIKSLIYIIKVLIKKFILFCYTPII
uniref:Uncharacterized protein n=1 Tax=Lepeophtheirus salmonis TaxID=72036 RepID=A0A0K2TFI0_LEPSM